MVNDRNSQLEITSKMLDLISDGKLSELEAERLLNATARLVAGVPTGTVPKQEQESSNKLV